MSYNKGTSKWSDATSFPYKIDYNDHFETPSVAYKDICSLIDFVAPKDKDRASHILYDPYYCNGRSKILLQELGFAKVQHERRDFYKDVERGMIPIHDTLVTNPPYSDQHKEKCMEFALQQLREQGRPFFILMPNYIASKDYYRRLIGLEQNGSHGEVVYVIPPDPYEYDHPDGTGHEIPPFASIWYCGIGVKKTGDVRAIWERSINQTTKNSRGHPRLAISIQELQQMGVIPTAKRPNPRQRKKLRRKKAMISESLQETDASPSNSATITVTEKAKPRKREDQLEISRATETNPGPAKRMKKGSRYRDAAGVRTKRRF